MLSKDLISKQLLNSLLIDFGTQLFGLDIVEADLLSNEQPRVEAKRSDFVARVREVDGNSYILHVEIQNDNQAYMPLRMLRYYADLALAHKGEPIKQCLLYIGRAQLTMPNQMQAIGWHYRYDILRVLHNLRPLAKNVDFCSQLGSKAQFIK